MKNQKHSIIQKVIAILLVLSIGLSFAGRNTNASEPQVSVFQAVMDTKKKNKADSPISPKVKKTAIWVAGTIAAVCAVSSMIFTSYTANEVFND